MNTIPDPWRQCDRCGSITPWNKCPCCGGRKLSVIETPYTDLSLGPIQCPSCGWAGLDPDLFDVIGADWGNLFCTQCHHEFMPPDEPHMVKCPESIDSRRLASVPPLRDERQKTLFTVNGGEQ